MKRRFDRFAVYLLGYAYAFILNYLSATIIFNKPLFWAVLLVSVVSYVLMNLVLSFRVTRVIMCALVVLAALSTGTLFLIKKADFIIDMAEEIYEVFTKIYYSEVITAPRQMLAAYIVYSAAALLISAVLFIIFNKFFRFFLVTGVLVAAQIVSWYITGRENALIIATISLLTVISYIRHVYEKKQRSGLMTDRGASGGIMFFSIPAAIIPVLLIMLLPKSDMPLQWPWLDQKIMKAIEYIEQRFSYTNVEFFSLSTTGFNGFSERLGGPVRPSNTIVMDVKAEKRTYLRGAAYSWYENNMWAQVRNDRIESVSNGENERELDETRRGWLFVPVEEMFPDAPPDDLELLMNLEDGRMNKILFPTYTVVVTYRNMTTRSLFIPLLTVMPIRDNRGPMTITENIHGIAIAEKMMPSGSSYRAVYAQPMYGEPMLKQALTYSRSTLYRDALTALYKQKSELIEANPELMKKETITQYSMDGTGNLIVSQKTIIKADSQQLFALKRMDTRIQEMQQFYETAGLIQQEYTRVSDTVPARVRDLALEITKNCRTDYEKVLAIQDYLKENYEYTLNASRIPPGRDFVDWFLFEDKRGYCTYFATAMTIMLRYNGIPARYVEGYVMPEQHTDNDVYTISNRNAHAWCEVYFQGFGWLTFEPTAVYAGVMDYKATPDRAWSSVDAPNVDIEELMKRYAARTDIPGYIPEDPMIAARSDLSKYLGYLPYAIGGIILLLIIINASAALLENLILTGTKGKKKVLRYYRMMLRWLENNGHSIRPGETAVEFGRRVDKYYYFESSTFSDASRIFTKVRYGGLEATPDEITMIRETAKALKKYVLREIGIRRYMPLRRIIKGI